VNTIHVNPHCDCATKQLGAEGETTVGRDVSQSTRMTIASHLHLLDEERKQ
jgi:hypothetical protein